MKAFFSLLAALAILNHSFPQRLQIQSFTIKFMRPIYPGYELSSELQIEDKEDFEMLLYRGEEKITLIKGKHQKIDEFDNSI